MSHNPIDDLIEEHKYILKVVNALDCFGSDLDKAIPLDERLLKNIIGFMREFADKCHHAKEEDLLFPAMVELGVPESGCPIGGLKGEHVKGRKLVGLLEEGLNEYKADPQKAVVIIKDAIDQIVKLYPEHIWKEDQMVFPMAKRLFDEGQLAHLEKAFNEVEKNKVSQHHKYETFVHTLRKD